MPMRPFMVLISCCPEILFPIPPSVRKHVRAETNLYSREHHIPWHVGWLRRTMCQPSCHGDIDGHHQAVNRMVK